LKRNETELSKSPFKATSIHKGYVRGGGSGQHQKTKMGRKKSSTKKKKIRKKLKEEGKAKEVLGCLGKKEKTLGEHWKLRIQKRESVGWLKR